MIFLLLPFCLPFFIIFSYAILFSTPVKNRQTSYPLGTSPVVRKLTMADSIAGRRTPNDRHVIRTQVSEGALLDT